jgi:hypothetical protein
MIQLLLGVSLAIFLILQFVIKRKRSRKTEVVIYESSSVRGRLFSLTKSGNIAGSVLVVLVLAIGISGYLRYASFYKIKNLIDHGQYSEAQIKIEDGKHCVIAVYRVEELEYTLKLNWAKSAIESKNWVEAVEKLSELKYNDSIPKDFVPAAFYSYYEYINSLIPFKDKKHFDEGVRFQFKDDAPSSHTYLEYLRLFNVDSLVIREAYELFEELKKINSIESNKTLLKATHDYHYIKSFLTLTSDSDFVAKEYLQNPIIKYTCQGCKDYPSLTERIAFRDSITSLEIKIIEYCVKSNLLSLELLIRAADYAFSYKSWEVEGPADPSGWVRPNLKITVEKAYLDLLDFYNWGEADFSIEADFLMRYLWMEHWNQTRQVRGDKKARRLKQFLAEYPIDRLLEYKKNIEISREKVESFIAEKGNWAISISEFNYLHFDSFGSIREECLRIGDYFVDDRNSDALYWYDLGLSLNVLFPYHNSFQPHRIIGKTAHLYKSNYYYYERAITKWNIKPYGPKFGYCDDLKKSMELGYEEALSDYLKDCN